MALTANSKYKGSKSGCLRGCSLFMLDIITKKAAHVVKNRVQSVVVCV